MKGFDDDAPTDACAVLSLTVSALRRPEVVAKAVDGCAGAVAPHQRLNRRQCSLDGTDASSLDSGVAACAEGTLVLLAAEHEIIRTEEIYQQIEVASLVVCRHDGSISGSA